MTTRHQLEVHRQKGAPEVRLQKEQIQVVRDLVAPRHSLAHIFCFGSLGGFHESRAGYGNVVDVAYCLNRAEEVLISNVLEAHFGFVGPALCTSVARTNTLARAS